MALSLDENHTDKEPSYTFVVVKYLFFIPMLALFLSNVPIFITVTLPKEQIAECAVEETDSCDEASMEMKCCKTSEGTCQLVSCFQVMVPLQQLSKFRFSEMTEQPSFNLYRQSLWQDPIVEGLIQPPDFV